MESLQLCQNFILANMSKRFIDIQRAVTHTLESEK